MHTALLTLIGRILIALLFIPAGFETLLNLAGPAAYFASLGLPVPTLTALAVGIVELLGGVLLMIGAQARLVALGMALFTAAAAFIGHFGQGGDDATLRFLHMQMFWKDIAIAGGLLILAAAGAGRYSLDARRRSPTT